MLQEDNKLREIDIEIAKLSLTFGENVLADTHAYELHITQDKDLKGLPNQVKEILGKLLNPWKKRGGFLHWIIPVISLLSPMPKTENYERNLFSLRASWFSR